MNRKSFIVRCALAVAAVMFPWKSTLGVRGVGPLETVLEDIKILNVEASFAQIASKFQWVCNPTSHYFQIVNPGATHLMQCWGKFQDGKDYQCTEYLDFEGEYVDGVWYEPDSEAILSEIATTFDLAMRRRFDQIENDRAQSS